MPTPYESTLGSVPEIRGLIERQAELEKELEQLKQSLAGMKKTNEEAMEEVNKRIDGIEEEIVKLSASINLVVASVERVQTTVNSVYKTVGKLDKRSDKTIEVQEAFIGQLWKAFFTILTIVTTGAGVIIALLK